MTRKSSCVVYVGSEGVRQAQEHKVKQLLRSVSSSRFYFVSSLLPSTFCLVERMKEISKGTSSKRLEAKTRQTPTSRKERENFLAHVVPPCIYPMCPYFFFSPPSYNYTTGLSIQKREAGENDWVGNSCQIVGNLSCEEWEAHRSVGRWLLLSTILKRKFKREPAGNDVSNCPCVLLFGGKKKKRVGTC